MKEGLAKKFTYIRISNFALSQCSGLQSIEEAFLKRVQAERMLHAGYKSRGSRIGKVMLFSCLGWTGSRLQDSWLIGKPRWWCWQRSSYFTGHLYTVALCRPTDGSNKTGWFLHRFSVTPIAFDGQCLYYDCVLYGEEGCSLKRHIETWSEKGSN